MVALFRWLGLEWKLEHVECFGHFVSPFSKSVIGKSTDSSMKSGIIYGYGALVDGMVQRIKTEMGTNPKVIATGGLAKVMQAVSETIESIEPNLTLEGLRILGETVGK